MAFRKETLPWLSRREAVFGLVIGIVNQLVSGEHNYEPPFFLAGVYRENDLVGCAYRTPPFKLGVTDLPREAAEPLATQVSAFYDSLPAVLGPERFARAFGAAWAKQQECSAAVGMRQRVHKATGVNRLESSPGELRTATEADIPLLVEWTGAFAAESGLQPVGYDERTRRMVAAGELFVWDHAGPRCMVAAVAPTERGTRIGYVYTPPENRRKGFATSATAALTERMLRQFEFCTLYTDLANPTSNAIYARIGFEPLEDVVDVVFTPR